jgi:hypothetical protein
MVIDVCQSNQPGEAKGSGKPTNSTASQELIRSAQFNPNYGAD